MPEISVIISCYNCEKYIAECLDSVLAQTFQSCEIVVVNDGSTDNSQAIIENYVAKYPHIRVINQENQGLIAARNNGVRASSGRYILPLDGDDRIHPEYLRKAFSKIEEDSSLGIVYCLADFFGCKNGRYELNEYSLANMINDNCIFCSALYRRADFDKVGGYKKEMKWGLEDWEFWICLIENGANVYMLPEVLFFYRQKDSGSMLRALSSSYRKTEEMRRMVMLLHLDFYRKYRKLLKYSNELRFRLVLGEKLPLFYKEKTSEYKIWHIGSWSFKVKRRMVNA